MLEKDYRDIVAGALLAALGIAISLYALSHYSIGTITRMGPGMVPVGLGVLLAIFGVVIGGTAWFREGNWPKGQGGNATAGAGVDPDFCAFDRKAGAGAGGVSVGAGGNACRTQDLPCFAA